MNLIRHNAESFNPFELVSDLQGEMNRIFNRSLTRRDGYGDVFAPSIEVREEADKFTLHADLPGLKKEDFNISVQGNQLILKGERKSEKESKEKGYFYSERYYGAFSRAFEFPTEIETDKVKAAYKDGVLELTLPKAESAKPKQIQIEVK